MSAGGRALVLGVLVVGIARAEPSAARLQGVVVDRRTEAPIAGVELIVATAPRRARTGVDGRFVIDALPPGVHHIEVRGAAIEPTEVDETLTAGETRDVRYLVDPRRSRQPRFATVIRAPRDRELAEMRVERGEAARTAGTQGDPAKIVQSLPGVARAAFGSGQLVVWGAAPAETRVYVDGVEIPALYHVGGIRSVLGSELVERLALTPGGQGAAFGRGTGGIVEIETRPLPTEGVHGAVGIDLLDASAFVTAAIGKRVQLAAAARYSLVDRLAARLVEPDVGAVVPVPQYDDYQLKAIFTLAARARLSVLLLAADDHLRRTVASADPAATQQERLDRSSYRVAVRYEHDGETDGDAQLRVTPFAGYDTERRATRVGATPTALDRTTIRYGLRADYRRRLARPLLLTVGIDLLGSRATIVRLGSLTVPAREGDPYVFGLPPGDDLAADRYHAHVLEAAPYVQAELRLGPATITPALRLNAVLIELDRAVPQLGPAPVLGASRLRWTLEPRLALVWRTPSPRVSVLASAGLYHQAPAVEDLSPVFGTPSLGLSRAVHVTAGLTARLAEGLTLELVGYWRRLDHLASRSALPSPQVAHALVAEGRGQSYGAQLVLRLQPWRGLSGWVTYAAARSERRDHPSSAVRAFDFDQTHALTLVASYAYRGWSFGLRLRYASGLPRTPVVGAFFEARDDQFQPRLGATNTTRLPDFVQLDLRIDRTITWARAALELYLDVQNVTYQRNPEEIVYSRDYTQRRYLTGLPTLAVLGARVLF